MKPTKIAYGRAAARVSETRDNHGRVSLTTGSGFGVLVLILSVALAVTGALTAAKIDLSDVFLTSGVISDLSIRLDDAALAALRLHLRSYVKGTVTEGQTVYPGVGVHLKGNYGTFQGVEGRPSLTLNLDKFVWGQKFHGLDKLHLNNSASDPTYLTEPLCRELFQIAGVPVARASHARLKLNGRDAGLYVLVEGYDKTFLRRYFNNTKGNLYDSEFMHDITEPLRKARSQTAEARSPESENRLEEDRSDLRALAAAAEEPDPNLRLHRLVSLLDLDRFYSFLALEIMTCHFDGYARAINNYWVYHEPSAPSPHPTLTTPAGSGEGIAASGKMIFLPHGMDQMFLQPQGSLFPELKGILAQAVLQTPHGRKQYRERCTSLFTNLFPALSNRVEELRRGLRPTLTQFGTNAVAQHDRAVADLQRRIDERTAHLRRQLLAPAPSLAPVGPGGMIPLTGWVWNIDAGKAALSEDAGKQVLNTRLETGGNAAVSWEKRVLLPKGQYQVVLRVSSSEPIFRGPKLPVALKMWGSQELQSESNRTDAQHIELIHTFEVQSNTPEDLLIQCLTRGGEETVTLQIGPILLARASVP